MFCLIAAFTFAVQRKYHPILVDIVPQENLFKIIIDLFHALLDFSDRTRSFIRNGYLGG